MANAVCNLAEKTPGKEAMAMEGFAKALRALPTVTSDNPEYDSAQLISELRAAHAQGKHTMGNYHLLFLSTHQLIAYSLAFGLNHSQ